MRVMSSGWMMRFASPMESARPRPLTVTVSEVNVLLKTMVLLSTVHFDVSELEMVSVTGCPGMALAVRVITRVP